MKSILIEQFNLLEDITRELVVLGQNTRGKKAHALVLERGRFHLCFVKNTIFLCIIKGLFEGKIFLVNIWQTIRPLIV